MPPKTKRKIHLSKAREAKKQKLSARPLDSDSAQPSTSTTDEQDTTVEQNRSEGSTQQESLQDSILEESKVSNEEKVTYLQEHIEEWTSTLSKDDLMSLAMTLHYSLVCVSGVSQTDAAQCIASLISKNERTVREWRYIFFKNEGNFPDNQQGKYRRQGVLWKNEELNEAASDYFRANAVVKGKPNLTSISFCRWVNEYLLPNSILVPGYPRKISVQTARLWLHELGFQVLDKKKGIYIDGHERDDVIKNRKKFLRKLVAGGFF